MSLFDTIGISLTVLVGVVLLLTYGNYLGHKSAPPATNLETSR